MRLALRNRLDGLRALVTGEVSLGPLTEPSVSFIHSAAGGKTLSGTRVDERTVEGLPAIYACVHVLSETAGQVPLKVFRLLDQGKEPDTRSTVYRLLHDQANPEMGAYQLKEMLTRQLAIWGRAYAQIIRDARGRPDALWPLHPSRMVVERDAMSRKVFKYWMATGDWRTWTHNPERPDILHLHINSDDGIDGRSPLQINRESLGITLAAEQYTGSWFGNGAIPGLIATAPRRLSPKAKESIRESWLKRFQGASNTNKLAILEEGITVQAVGVDPEKSQLDRLRQAQLEAAARIYRVPLFMIQEQTKQTSWGTGIAEQMTGFVNVTMMPWFIQWQQASRMALLPRSRSTHDIAFVLNALVRGDITRRFEAYTKARQNGWLNGDEIRELEDLNPIEQGLGKIYWQPLNMVPAGTLPPALVEPDGGDGGGDGDDGDDATPTPAAPEPDGVM